MQDRYLFPFLSIITLIDPMVLAVILALHASNSVVRNFTALYHRTFFPKNKSGRIVSVIRAVWRDIENFFSVGTEKMSIVLKQTWF